MHTEAEKMLIKEMAKIMVQQDTDPRKVNGRDKERLYSVLTAEMLSDARELANDYFKGKSRGTKK